MELPAPLREADRRLAGLLNRYRLAEHLNPLNPAEARARWTAGRAAPPFTYAPVPWADEALRALDAVRPPEDHPLGGTIQLAAEEFRFFVLALRDRTAASFHALAEVHGWYPDPIAPPGRLHPSPASYQPARVPASEMLQVLRDALDTRGLQAWSTRLDPILSSRVLVDAPRREVRVNPRASFRDADKATLIAHEIDVHVQRSVNGDVQPLEVFRTGLPGALATEEGLAILAEERAGASTAHLVDRQALVAAAVLLAREAGFAEVHQMLAERVGPEAAWNIALRVKRGLADPAEPGVFAKDAVYHIGYHAVRDWLGAGGRLARLYVGKVATHHPVDAWVDAAWIVPAAAPALWDSGP